MNEKTNKASIVVQIDCLQFSCSVRRPFVVIQFETPKTLEACGVVVRSLTNKDFYFGCDFALVTEDLDLVDLCVVPIETEAYLLRIITIWSGLPSSCATVFI
jgi:hypothetical protein